MCVNHILSGTQAEPEEGPNISSLHGLPFLVCSLITFQNGYAVLLTFILTMNTS